MTQLNIVIRAAQFASKAHAGQKRKYNGRDYIEHPMRVAGRVIIRPDADESMVAAAWLHDTVENCGVTRQQIHEEIGHCTAVLVEELTNMSAQYRSTLSRKIRKQLDRERIAKVSLPAKFIKLLDRIDNLSEIIVDARANEEAARFLPVYREESRLLLEVLKGTDAGLEEELAELCK